MPEIDPTSPRAAAANWQETPEEQVETALVAGLAPGTNNPTRHDPPYEMKNERSSYKDHHIRI